MFRISKKSPTTVENMSKVRSRINKHLAKFIYTRYQIITHCSPGHPFVRKLARGGVSFTNPDELISFLTKSTDAELMWCDSEDLSVIADLYQINFLPTKFFLPKIIFRQKNFSPKKNFRKKKLSSKKIPRLEKICLKKMLPKKKKSPKKIC